MIGQILGHYQVIEQLGAGGMGVVYRARDARLERDVALKVLPAGLLEDAAARKRFRNEALALARLNHPNICSVFDFDTAEGIDFLVMEFVPGVSLDTTLANGSLPLEEVPRLGSQLAAGLEAAHGQGVLHRDLKPGNLRVTPDGRLKILDFGLAKLFHPGESAEATLSLNETSSFSGTVPYMAPEQLRNDPPDPRTDIYSAGTVLYQCATGQRAFPENQLAKLIDAVLHHDAVPASQVNRRISPGLEAVIHKAMDRRPELRYQSASELRIDLERLGGGQAPQAARPARAVQRRNRLQAAAWTLIAILAGGIAMGVYVSRRNAAARRAAESTPAAGVAQRRSVAVIGFKNLSPQSDTAWLSTALSEMLTTELGAGERLRTVSSENVARMRTDLALKDEVSYAPDTLQRIRTISGSDAVILGSYVVVPDRSGAKIRVDLRIQETRTGETLKTVKEVGEENELLEVVARAGSKLRDSLGAPAISADEANRARAALPSSSTAAELYAKGLDKLRVFDSGAARDLLEKAAAADLLNAKIQVARAVAWGQLGYDEKAREAAKRAMDLSANLSREDRLSIEARYRESVHDYDRAIEIYRSLREFFPDNPDYALRLATAQTSSRKGKDALATLDQFRATFPNAKEDPRVDLTEASAADGLADFKLEQAAAARGADKARQRGERLLAARALLLEGWAWHNLGDNAKATAVSLEAKAAYDEVGDRVGESRALHNLGNIASGQSKLDEAEKYFHQAIAIRTQAQDNVGLARAYNDMAVISEHRGDLPGARKLYEQSLGIARRVGDKSAVAMALANLGNVYNAQGNVAEGRKSYEQAVVLFREVGNKQGLAAVLANLGNLAVNAGDTDSGIKMLQESANGLEQVGNASGVAQIRSSIGEVYFQRGEFAPAVENFRQSWQMAEKVGDAVTAAQAQAALAVIERVQGDFASANTNSEAALAKARAAGDAEVLADAVLNRSTLLLATGDLAGARKLTEEALATAQKSGDKRFINEALADRSEILLFGDDLAGAVGDSSQALALQQQLKDSTGATQSRLDLARVALEQRQAARAGELARQAAAAAHGAKSTQTEARCYLVLAGVALSPPPSAAGAAEAQKLLARASALIGRNPVPAVQLMTAVQTARARVAAGVNAADTRKGLEAAFTEMGPKSGFDVRLEARLALAELQAEGGDPAGALSALDGIEKEATSHGFLLAARKAKTLSAAIRK
jgi:tetratricopeptide (TPR) repeat protein